MGGHRGSIEVTVRLHTPLTVRLEVGAEPVDAAAAVDKPSVRSFSISHLPPVKLEFSLPTDYPALSSPLHHLSCSWLTKEQREKVSSHLNKLWTDNRGNVILFVWLDFLQEELLDFLNVRDEIDITPIVVRARNMSGGKGERRETISEVIDDDDDGCQKDNGEECGLARMVKIQDESQLIVPSGSKELTIKSQEERGRQQSD